MRIEPYEITNKQENISNQTNQKLTNSLNTNKLDIIKNIMPLLSNNQNGNSPISSLLSSFAPQTSKVNPTNNIQSLSDKQNENNIQKSNQYEQSNNFNNGQYREYTKNNFDNNNIDINFRFNVCCNICTSIY